MLSESSMLDRWISLALIGGVVSSVVSIAVSDTLYGISILLWLVDCWKRRRFHLQFPPFFGFVVAFLVAALAAVCFSSDVTASAPYLGEFIKFLYIPLIFTYVPRERVEQVLKALFAVMGASAGYGLLQYFWLLEVNLLNRIDGFMGHWMTFSGQLMLGSVALTAYLIFYRLPQPSARNPEGHGRDQRQLDRFSIEEMFKRGGWVTLLLVFLLVLILTHTRSTWLGTIGGVLLLLWVLRFRWMIAGFGVLVLLFILLPTSFKQRLYSSFDPADTTTRIRLELLDTGRNIIEARPWLGLGPRMVPRLYQNFNGTDEFSGSIYQHLHNNFVHIAAEMGLITLGVWLAVWVRLLRDFTRFARRSSDRWSFSVAMTGIGVLVAFLLAGLFEYNFGDSEILILLLFLVTVPYVASREPAEAA